MSYRIFKNPIIIDKENYKNEKIRKKLEILHFTHHFSDRKRVWKKEKKHHMELIKGFSKEENWLSFIRITENLNALHYPNLFPDYLLKLYAPYFFKKYPDGKIWFIPFNKSDREILIRDEKILADRYNPSTHPLGAAQSYGIEFDSTLISFGLEIPMFLRFPYFQGTITGTMSGIACFVINKPIVMYDGHWNLHAFLMEKTRWVYTDSNANPFSNPRSTLNPLNSKDFTKYFNWYISTLNNLYDFVLNIRNLEKKHLVGFTLARICLDTYLIQIIEEPYLRKMLFFTLLDKYENLIHEFGSRKADTKIWKELLSLSYFEKNLKHIVKKTPRVLQLLQGIRYNLKHTIKHVLHTKYENRISAKPHEKEAIDLLRAYRNSHHGYLLRSNQRKKFFEHTGEIPNYLPDYSLDLWHVFITDPKEFVNKLK